MGLFDAAPDNSAVTPAESGQGEQGTGSESTNNPAEENQVQETAAVETPSQEEQGAEAGAEETKPEMDYKKAYLSLLPEFTKKSQELSALKKGNSQGQESPMTKQAQESATEQLANEMANWDQETTEAFWEAMNENPGKTLQAMFQRMMEKSAPALLKPYEADRQARELEKTSETVDKTAKALAVDFPSIASEEGFRSLVSKAREIAEEFTGSRTTDDPKTAKLASDPRVMRAAALELFPEDKAQLISAVKQQAAEEVRNNIKAKNGAGVTVNSRQTGKPQAKTPEQSTKENILSFRKGGLF